MTHATCIGQHFYTFGETCPTCNQPLTKEKAQQMAAERRQFAEGAKAANARRLLEEELMMAASRERGSPHTPEYFFRVASHRPDRAR